MKWELPGYASCPRFDAIILGIGEDGHTASIFPSMPELLTAKCCYKVSQHPESGQKRITMTGSLILNAKLLLIPVLGNAKTSILQRVINAEENSVLPAAYIINHAPEAMIFTDLQVSLE